MGKQQSFLMSCPTKEPAEPMIKVKNAEFTRLSYYQNEIQIFNILASNERLRLLHQKTNAVDTTRDMTIHIHRMRTLIVPTVNDEFASGTAFVEFNDLTTVQSGK